MISQRDRKADAPAQPTLMRRIMCWKVRLPAIGSPTSLRSASSLGRGQVAFPNRRLFSMLRLYRRWASGRMRRGTGVTRDYLPGIEARARDMGRRCGTYIAKCTWDQHLVFAIPYGRRGIKDRARHG